MLLVDLKLKSDMTFSKHIFFEEEKNNSMIIQRKDKIVSLQIMRIIACLGVFNGHFLGHSINSEIAHGFFYTIRTNWVSNSILSYFYMGDQNVKIFYILGGFFVSYSLFEDFSNCEDRKILGTFIKRMMNLIVPSFVVIGITALAWWILSFWGYDVFKAKEILFDYAKLLIGNDEGYTPYYAYQLWYIYTMLKGYILTFGFWSLFGRNGVLRYIAYIVVLSYFLFVDPALFCIFVGSLAGDVAKQIDKKVIEKAQMVYLEILTIILIMISPLFFDGSNKDIDVMMLGGILAIIVVLMYAIERKRSFKGYKWIDFLDKYTYAFYLVHVFVLDIFSKTVFEKLRFFACTSRREIALVIIAYIIAIGITLLFCIIFEYMVMQKNMTYTKWIINKLENAKEINR